MTVRNTVELGRAVDAITDAAEQGIERAARRELEKIEDGFDAGTDALGRPWAPLAPETIDAKGHDQILVDEGDLRGSFAVKTEEGRVVLMSDSPVLPYHEFGTQTIPRRPVMEPARVDLKEHTLPEVIETEIKNALREFKATGL